MGFPLADEDGIESNQHDGVTHDSKKEKTVTFAETEDSIITSPNVGIRSRKGKMIGAVPAGSMRTIGVIDEAPKNTPTQTTGQHKAQLRQHTTRKQRP